MVVADFVSVCLYLCEKYREFGKDFRVFVVSRCSGTEEEESHWFSCA